MTRALFSSHRRCRILPRLVVCVLSILSLCYDEVTGPEQLFKLLFVGVSEHDKLAMADRFSLQGSILDMVRGDADRLERKLNQQDRIKLDEYLTSVRDVGNRIGLRRNWLDIPKPEAPFAAPKNRNTVGDLLGIDMTMFDPTIEFLADNLSNHFDNFGDALVTSGYLLEKYLDSADRCIEKALPEALSESPEKQALAKQSRSNPQEWVFNSKFEQSSIRFHTRKSANASGSSPCL